MKTTIIIMFIFTVNLILYSQSKTNQLFIPPLSLNHYSENRPFSYDECNYREESDSSSHFGFEFGNIYRLTDSKKDEYFGTLWLFGDFNLYKKIIFLNLILGGVYGKKIDGMQTQYSLSIFFAVGTDFKVFQKKRHILYLSSGLMLMVNMQGSGGGLFVTANPKYVLLINKYFGITVSVKYMFPLFDYRGLILPSVGIKFFL